MAVLERSMGMDMEEVVEDVVVDPNPLRPVEAEEEEEDFFFFLGFFLACRIVCAVVVVVDVMVEDGVLDMVGMDGEKDHTNDVVDISKVRRPSRFFGCRHDILLFLSLFLNGMIDG